MNEKLSFENSHRMWVQYMVWCIFCKYAYPTLQAMAPCSYEEWCKPDMYFIDGINKKELPHRYEGKEYLSSQIETINEWCSIKKSLY